MMIEGQGGFARGHGILRPESGERCQAGDEEKSVQEERDAGGVHDMGETKRWSKRNDRDGMDDEYGALMHDLSSTHP
jgi:hypothetical protein